MPKLKLWIVSLLTIALLLPVSAWAATMVNISLGPGDCSGTTVGSTIHLDQSGSACAVDVFMDYTIGVLDITAFNISLTGSNLDMSAFTFTQSLTGPGSGGFPSTVAINAADKPSNLVRIGYLDLAPSTLGGTITLGGTWTDDGLPFGSTHAFDNDGAVLAKVPEPSSLGLLLTGILGLAIRRPRNTA